MKLSNYQWAMIGLNLVTILFVSLGIGIYLDKKHNSSPKFILIFLTLGILNVFITLWKVNQKLNQAMKNETK